MKLRRINKEILMVVIVFLICAIVAGFVFVHIENIRMKEFLPDTDMHMKTGVITEVRSVEAKSMGIEFTDGGNITFEGRDVSTIVSILNVGTEYQFSWKWDTFYTETASVNHIARRCIKISMGSDVVYEWIPDEPYMEYTLSVMLIVLIGAGILTFFCRKVDEEDDSVEKK